VNIEKARVFEKYFLGPLFCSAYYMHFTTKSQLIQGNKNNPLPFSGRGLLVNGKA